MTSRWERLWMGLLVIALVACAKSMTSGGSSETHFLTLCDEDACGEGLGCVCGVCTEACEPGASGACGELNERASCVAIARSSCEEAEAVCDVRCDADADCSPLGRHTCEAGRCRAPALDAQPDAGGSTAPPPDGGASCPPDACVIDGVCYPNGASTEDGCCYCENGSHACIEPGWCPSWPLIGKRCDTDADCRAVGSDSGLRCQRSTTGSADVCTRPCNYGCPTGTACVQLEGFSGELCMRDCTAGSESCELEVFGEPLGTTCTATETERAYCL